MTFDTNLTVSQGFLDSADADDFNTFCEMSV